MNVSFVLSIKNTGHTQLIQPSLHGTLV